MTEQKSLSGYKSKVVEGSEFENPNVGKPLLNSDDEYVFRLTKMPHVIPGFNTKKNKDGVEVKVPVEKAVAEWEEMGTKNIVVSFFRIDSVNRSDDEAFESAVVKFFRKIKAPLPETGDIVWENHFVPGMRFRGRVVVKTGVDKDNQPVVRYYLDVPTCRKLLPSDTAGEDFNTPSQLKPEAYLANAMFIVKGSKDSQEALAKLKTANADKEVTMAFFNADLEGKVKYPI